ncbi:MAG TPA: LON peptidase substrate-binding domain-containing protein [Alphaproteobacteria bacterium]|jgi:Lon protease-like protein|nr:LON peptidase substrate-binding domain-containing protein [Alphaproteobacteria bacterium]
MSGNPFTPTFDSLPGVIPVFPLAGVLLLPRGKMPLNIFERRYLAMTRAALSDPVRIIGMIQPTGTGDGPNGPELFRVGCAGRLISFAETDDGRYLITLDGLCRFRTGAELPIRDGYRRFEVDWSPFRADLEERSSDRAPIQRAGIASAAAAYFRGRNMSVNPEALKKLGDSELVTALSMGCPFTPEEKQALLEASNLEERAKLLETLFAMGAKELFGDGEVTRH